MGGGGGWVHNEFSVLRLSKLVLDLKSCPMVSRKYECCLKINGCFMDVQECLKEDWKVYQAVKGFLRYLK